MCFKKIPEERRQKGHKEQACQLQWKEPGGGWGEEQQDRITQKTNACLLAIFLNSNILQIFRRKRSVHFFEPLSEISHLFLTEAALSGKLKS